MIRWLTRAEQAIEYWDTLRVAPPANLRALESDAFRSTRGILKDPSDPGRGYEVSPMPRERFQSRAEWIVQTLTPDPLTGEIPAFVPVARFQTELEEEIARMLNEYLNESSTKSASEVLGRAARNVRAIIRRGEPDGQPR